MSIFKCKMCGGTIEFEPGATVGVCDSCGTKQTLPKLDDDRKTNLYDRANHFRRNNEYDKAMAIYEQILNEDPEDAESYWSIVLCRYGIEYVEDPTTHKRIPTVNRAQFTSIFDDEDYREAISHADTLQKLIYEQEAKTINDIQKGILEISSKEKPFDVFICYKETDANGRRTQDSVLANDLYHQLTQEGFKVFFSRITLEDKLGTAYEPYIFAALNSAKVMVVLGTKPEYFNAVWVKNEWSRYLALIRNGAKKMLIPAYRDMDPYDLPEEFSHLQAQDMSKLGFMQDLIRGIKKIIGENTAVPQAGQIEAVTAAGAVVAPLLKRAFMFLEDGSWEDADAYCEKILDQDPENAEAYFGKLMAQMQTHNPEELRESDEAFDHLSNYQKAYRFGSDSLKEKLESIRLGQLYHTAVCTMRNAHDEETFKVAAGQFEQIKGFKDAAQLSEECLQFAEKCRKDAIYESARETLSSGKIEDYEKAGEAFQTIADWKDSAQQIRYCQQRIEEIKAKEEADRLEAERKAEERRIAAEKASKKRKKAFAIGTPIVVACIAFVIVLSTVIIPNSKYNAAVSLMNDSKYDEAIPAFEALNGYKDSENQIECCYIGKYGEEKWNKIKNIKIGDTYTFGAYEQDNNTSNGKEAIEWTVLDKDGMSLLLVSKQALDCQRYNTSYTDVTWENCSLRKWMNGTFLNNAFSAGEQAQIQNTNVSADENPKYSTNPGNATSDKVFLLSITEVEKYFSSDSARQCKPSKYAVANGAYVYSDNGNCWWWLRSPGNFQNYAAYVCTDGPVNYFGRAVSGDNGCVRPALWINLGS